MKLHIYNHLALRIHNIAKQQRKDFFFMRLIQQTKHFKHN